MHGRESTAQRRSACPERLRVPQVWRNAWAEVSMRVGRRRLRSALDLFAPVIAAPADFDAELRWIAGDLGAARD